jgi:hypothetical protein
MFHRIWSSLALVSLVGGAFSIGCSGSDDPKPGDGEVLFLDPTDEAVLGAADDLDASEPGVQYNVRVQVTHRSGVAELQLSTNNLEAATVALTGTEREAERTFVGFTLPVGENTLTLRLVDDGETVVEQTIAVTVTDEATGETPSLAFVAPIDDATLVAADDLDTNAEGLQIDVVLETVNIAENTPVALEVNGVAIANAATGAAGVTFASVTLAEGESTLRATVTVDDTEYDSEIAVTVELTEPNPPTLTINAPLDGASFTAADDTDPVAAGFQLDVTAITTDIDAGTQVLLSLNGAAGPTATVADGLLEFSDVTVGNGETTLEVSTVIDDVVVSDEVTIFVDAGGCTIDLAPLPSDEACAVTLAAGDADPNTAGAQLAFTAETTCAVLELVVDGEVVGAVSAAEGAATFENITLADGIHVIQATGVDGDIVGATPEYSFVIDTTAPEVDVTAPLAATYYPVDDIDIDTDGLQLTVTGTSDAGEDATVQIVLDGLAAGEATVAGDGSWSFALTLPANGVYQLSTTVIDTCGNPTSSEPVALKAYVTNPSLAIVSPTDGALLNAASDINVGVAGVQAEIGVSSEFPDGTEFQVECRATGGSTYSVVATGTLTTGAASVVATVPEGSNECRVTTAEPIVLASEVVNIVVDSLVPTVSIVAPVDGALFTSLTVALTANFAGSDSAEVLSATAALGDAAAFDLTIVEGTASSDLVVDADGIYEVTVTVSDAAGNTAAASATFTVDTTPVGLVALSPQDGDTLSDSDVTNTAAGLTVSPSVTLSAVNGATEVCASSNGATAVCASTGLNGAFTLPAVLVQPGANTIAYTATDAAGNITSLEISFDVAVSLPRITIVTPTDGTATRVPTVTISATSDLPAGTTATLFKNDTEVANIPAAAGGALSFAGVSLATGANSFRIEATDARGTGVSAPVVVTYDVTAPSVAFVRPTNGATLSLATPDTSGDAGFQYDVALQVTDNDAVEDAVSIEVSCTGGTVQNRTGTTESGGTIVFAGFTLPNVGSCTLRATVTDAAGNTATEEITIGVDRVAPTISWQQPLNGEVLIPTLDQSGDAGFQYDLRVRVDGSAIGQTVRVTVESGGPILATYTSTPLTAINQAVTIPTITLPDGVVTLRATVTDAVGNRSTEAVSTVTVTTTVSGLFVTAPSSGSTLNAASDISGATAGLQTNVSANVFGEFSGLTAHLCIESADVGLTPCARSGYGRLASTEITGTTVTWPTVTLPEGVVRLSGEIQIGGGQLLGRNIVSTTVDSQRPTLLTFVMPTDADSNGTITAGEDLVAGGAANVQVTLSFDGVENGRTVTVRSSLPVAGTVVGTGTVTGGTATVDLALQQGTQTLSASVNDTAGNSLASGAPTLAITVDTIAPTLTFVAPAANAVLKATSDEDADAGLQYTVTLTSNAGNGRNIALVAVIGGVDVPVGIATLAGTAASATVTLPEGAYTLRADVTDTAGNPTSATRNITVDSIAPSVVVASPAVGETIPLTLADDASGSPGLQANVALTFADATIGDAIVVRSSLLGTPIATTTVTNATAQSVTVTLPSPGEHVISASVTDAVGNVGTADGGTLAATFESCGVAMTAPTGDILGTIAADDGNAANGFGVVFSFTTIDPACNGYNAFLVYEPIPELGLNQVIASTTVAANAGTFGNVAIPDGTIGRLFIEVTNGGDGSLSNAVGVEIDLTAPSVTTVTPGGGSPTLIGIGQASSFGPGAVDFSVDFVNDGAGTIEIYRDDVLVIDSAVDASPFVLPGFALGEGSVSLDFYVIDSVGNVSDVVTETYTVDWTAPNAPALTLDVANPRTLEGSLLFTGSTADTQSYEARFSSSPITTEEEWDAATSLGTLPAAAGELSFDVGPMPLFQQSYYFALAAFDAVGNQSVPSTVSGLAGVAFRDIPTALTSATWVAFLRDVNGDGFDDWAVGGGVSGTPRVVLVYGAADVTTGAVASLAQPGGSGSFWGATIYAVGDVNGDGFDDVVLPDAGNSRAYLHLGSASGISATPDTTITYSGSAGNFFPSNFHQGIGDVLDIDGDLTDDGLDDLVLASPFESAAPLATVFVIAGRTTWPASITLTTNATTNAALGAARVSHTLSNSQFGYRTVIAPDIDGDGYSELAISARNTGITGTFGGLFYFNGGTFCDAGCDFLSAGQTQTAVDGGPYTGNRTGSGWGTEAVTGGEDLDGDGLADFMVADVLDVAFDIILGDAPMPAAISQSSTITGYPSTTFRVGGNASMVGDVRYDYVADPDTAYSDLLVAIRQAPSTPAFNDVVLFLNSGTGTFSHTGTTAISLGSGGVLPMGGGDANGDGFRDFALFLPNASGGTFRLCY